MTMVSRMEWMQSCENKGVMEKHIALRFSKIIANQETAHMEEAN